MNPIIYDDKFTEDNSFEKVVCCNLCSKICENISELDKHSIAHLHYSSCTKKASTAAVVQVLKEPSPAEEEKQLFNAGVLVEKGQLHVSTLSASKNSGCNLKFSCSLPSLILGNDQEYNERYICDKCQEVFNDKELLKRHCLACYMKEDKCIENNATNNNVVNQLQFKECKSISPYICDVCAQTFINEHLLHVHYSVYHLKDFSVLAKPEVNELQFKGRKHVSPYICDFCAQSFINEYLLRVHYSIYHLKTFSVPAKSGGLYICDVCRKEFVEYIDFNHHIHYHTERNEKECTDCPVRTFKLQEYLTDHNVSTSANISSKYPKKYLCELCKEKQFNFKTIFHEHLLQHCNESNNPICGICNTHFISKQLLCDHLLTDHEINSFGKPFICSICHIAFAEYKELLSHQQLDSHSNFLSPYICGICNEKFSLKTKLCEHVKCQHGKVQEKPFICSLCHEAFFTHSFLLQHLRIHTGEKGFSCYLCFEIFQSRNELRRHKTRVHELEKKYACEFCGKTFAEKKFLTNHRRVHTGEKPYVCDICHKACTQKSNLEIHYRTHTGDKRYVCEVCGERYMYKPQLNQHQKKHSTTEKLKS